MWGATRFLGVTKLVKKRTILADANMWREGDMHVDLGQTRAVLRTNTRTGAAFWQQLAEKPRQCLCFVLIL